MCFGKGPEPDLSGLDLEFGEEETEQENLENQINKEKNLDDILGKIGNL